MEHPTQKRTIIAVAQSRGSAAKTREGAWKYLLTHMPKPHAGLAAVGMGYRLQYADKWDFDRWNRKRMDRRAEGIARALGYDPNDPNTPARVEAREQRRQEWEIMLAGSSASILDAQKHNRSVRIGDAIYSPNSDEDRDYNYYSKSWHRSYGPKITISNRRVERLEFADDICYKITRTVSIDAFRGNWLINAIAQDLKLTKISVRKKLKPVQLNPYMQVEHIRTIAGVEIYRRMFALELVDYCVLCNGDSFHAATITEAINGLRKKREAVATHNNEVLNMDYALSLGFCRAGVEQFCDDYGLNCEAVYTRAELKKLVHLGNGKAEKYRPELVKAGILA